MPVLNDGSFLYGAATCLIGAVTTVLEQITDTESGTTIDVRNQISAPSGRIVIPSFKNGTATAQKGTTATVPSVGDTFTLFAEAKVIQEVGHVYTQGDIQKYTFSFYKKIN